MVGRRHLMLNIRLARTGRKRDAHFRVVVSDSAHGRVGRIVETVGHYHPRMPDGAEGRLAVNTDRTRYWIGQGAKPSTTVRNLLKRAGAPDETPDEPAPQATAETTEQAKAEPTEQASD